MRISKPSAFDQSRDSVAVNPEAISEHIDGCPSFVGRNQLSDLIRP